MKLLVISFHRSLSSSLSQWLYRAGLNMGFYLMPPAISNPEGHFEDMRLVDLHDRLLRINGVNWQFHDQITLEPPQQVDLISRYILQRDLTSGDTWGAKDPRTCLFLPAWRKALGKHGRYLVLLRHWSGSVQSLYRRHSQVLALGEGSVWGDAIFWRDPERAARMWLAYHRRILDLLEEDRELCLVVTQKALIAGLPVIEKVNSRFCLSLDIETASPIRHSLSHDSIEVSIRDRLSVSLIDELEAMWQRLLEFTDHRAESEHPHWVQDRQVGTHAKLLLAAADRVDSPAILSSHMPEGTLKEQLELLAKHTHLPLDSVYWQERIEREARFDPECWEHLARSQMARGNSLEAKNTLGKVLLCGKVMPYLFHLLGICHESELDDEAAEHFYWQAIARNDANPSFHVRLSRLWFSQGHFGLAESHLRKALERHPNKSPLVQALAEGLDLQGKTDQGIALLASINSRPPLLEYQLASLHMKQAPENFSSVHSALRRQRASDPATQLVVLQAIAGVKHLAARADLARRIAVVWQDLDIELIESPAKPDNIHRNRSWLHKVSSAFSRRR
ncbi:hypothetical protein M8009_02855 [Halomonas sp. ATCH28]|uniref:Tetratricopeptide repeat protein n=1 Tax=Halomonas gemina TaxID=2945105 RepID=A0ABT0SX54_9GAMM|nr:hypothetical protein [Halomonas gemina]MCL7939244.1 hypothetical protein [Halomonas gemina]